MIDEWDLGSTNQRRIRAQEYEAAVIPVGSMEPHNWHLPEGMDWRAATYVSREASRRAWERGARVICLPALPFSSDANLMDFPLTIDVRQATVDAVVSDIVRSLRRHGIRKFLLLNAHGGNHFIPVIRVLQADLDVHVFLCNWWMVGHDKEPEIFSKPDDHAGEVETSVALALFPDEVELQHAGPGAPAPYRFEALQKGWIQTARRFNRLNDHCAVGDPRAATAEKGRTYLELVCGRISSFLVELAASPIDAAFPQVPGGGAAVSP
jgi:creatinine amidohydrolase